MEISRNSKRMAMEDIITNLASDVLNCILDHLPVRDAARTSILSRKWRYIWASHPNLVLDPKNMLGNLADSQHNTVTLTNNDFVGIVNEILLQHTGPILTFNVNLSNVDMTQYPNVDRWILYLSRNGLRKLTLGNSSQNLYALPSYIFLCQELWSLHLSKCVFKRPCGTTGSFLNLKTLYLTQVVFMPEVSASLFTASKLQYWVLRNCSGIDHLNFDGCSTSLIALTLFKNDAVKLRCFMNCKGIRIACLTSSMQVESFGSGERINLSGLFENWPLISRIILDGYYLKFLAAGSVTSALPVKVYNLRELILVEVNFTDLEQISCILCLLHSSPAVHSLQFWVKVPAVIADNNLALQYLQARSCLSEDINSLQTVMIKYSQGTLLWTIE